MTLWNMAINDPLEFFPKVVNNAVTVISEFTVLNLIVSSLEDTIFAAMQNAFCFDFVVLMLRAQI